MSIWNDTQLDVFVQRRLEISCYSVHQRTFLVNIKGSRGVADVVLVKTRLSCSHLALGEINWMRKGPKLLMFAWRIISLLSEAKNVPYQGTLLPCT